MSEPSQQANSTREKKKGIPFFGYFSLLLSFSIVCAAVMWEVYALYPQYYLAGSFSLLGIAGVVGYVILTKTIRIS